jgi:uncharacterized protein YhfF
VETDPAETAPHLRVERFWQTFVAATGIDGPYTAWGFGSDATALGLLVRDGPKRATASNYSWYRDDGEPMPEVGHLSVVLDGEGEPLCVIRTTDVEVRRFGDVDEEFAWTEGEGDRSLAHWRTARTSSSSRAREDPLTRTVRSCWSDSSCCGPGRRRPPQPARSRTHGQASRGDLRVRRFCRSPWCSGSRSSPAS